MLVRKKAKSILCLALTGTILVGSLLNVSAAESGKIPVRMQPKTVIRYEADGSYTVLEGGVLDDQNGDVLTKEEQEVADKNLEDAIKEAGSQEIIEVPDYKPQRGMVVEYADDGFIAHISGSLLKYKPLKPGTTSPNGTYKWGAHNNTLTVTSNKVNGKGRATTFVDTIGESDNTLKKNDIATRGDKDNPKYGKAISVTAAKKSGGNVTVTMYKRDNGALPDAIVDIWRTGVENWGYTYNSSLSIENASYTYDR
ncbi:MAG: hypothetical protein LBN09_07255 [Clostridioides sp.]|jgi:hypothetical protein|nr:hypothetical protein [Clostridioides sp.]